MYYEKEFQAALDACDMTLVVTIETYRKWITHTRSFQPGFAMKALFFLIPEDITDDKRDELLNASQAYTNNLPHTKLKNKNSWRSFCRI